ncbi:kinase-like domain-containing protein [Rhizophagus irregularis DAOM 181602=DAOM 197198]|nr:kinase-like domain-containing protein [Rhizophagus irregularis DAOM 181602=DAOM 197198]
MGLVHCLMLHQKPFVIFLGLLSEATLETITPRNRWKFGWFDNDVNIPFKRFFSEVATNFPKEVDPLYESQPLRHTNIRRDFLPSKLAEHDRYARNLTNMINWENEPVNLTGEQGVYFIPKRKEINVNYGILGYGGACYRRCEFNFSTRPNHTRKVHQDISRIRTQMMIVHTNVNVDNRMKTKFINPLLRKISIILRYHDDLLTSASGESKIMMKRICIEEINHQFLPKVSWLLSSKRGCRFEDSQIYREISTLHALDDYIIFQIILDLLLCLEKNMPVVTRMEMWPYETIIRDYIDLVESLELLIDKLDGELKSFVAIIEIVSRWKIINEEKWLERFGAEVKQLHERGHHLPRKALLDITEI